MLPVCHPDDEGGGISQVVTTGFGKGHTQASDLSPELPVRINRRDPSSFVVRMTERADPAYRVVIGLLLTLGSSLTQLRS